MEQDPAYKMLYKQPLFIVGVWLAPGSAPEFVHG